MSTAISREEARAKLEDLARQQIYRHPKDVCNQAANFCLLAESWEFFGEAANYVARADSYRDSSQRLTGDNKRSEEKLATVCFQIANILYLVSK